MTYGELKNNIPKNGNIKTLKKRIRPNAEMVGKIYKENISLSQYFKHYKHRLRNKTWGVIKQLDIRASNNNLAPIWGNNEERNGGPNYMNGMYNDDTYTEPPPNYIIDAQEKYT